MLVDITKYKKESPDIDAHHIIIICEGTKREYQYFKYFRNLASRLKLVIIPPEDGRTHPDQLWETAESYLRKKETQYDELWLVFDVDHDPKSSKKIISKSKNANISIATSNPCFEVWLYYHKKKCIPDEINISQCGEWKVYLNDEVFKGGFDWKYYPGRIEDAIQNSRDTYNVENGLPKEGTTNLYTLGETIFDLVKQRMKLLSPDN